MRAGLAGSVAVASLLLAGCGSATGGTADAGPTGQGVDTVDCGQVSLGQGESTIPATPLTCLSDASASGSAATLAVLALTTEGDVITTTYTVIDTGRVRMIVDSTQDKFAGEGAGLTQQTCDLGTDGGLITVTNCTEPEPF